MNSLSEREDGIKDAWHLLNKQEKKWQILRGQSKVLKEARATRDNLLKEAKEMKETIINDAKEEAKSQADKILTQAKRLSKWRSKLQFLP